MPEENRFFIGELAARTGASRETIRFYERQGVLPEPDRSDSGYRLYAQEDVERLHFVSRAQALGLRLDEIAETLEIVDRGREPCVHVRHALRERLEETRSRIRELQELEARLERALERASQEKAPGGESCRCRIIEDAESAGFAASAEENGS